MFQKSSVTKAEKPKREVPQEMVIGSLSTSIGSCLSGDKILVFGKIKDSIIKCRHLTIFSGGSVSGLVYSDKLEVHNGGLLDARCFIASDRQFVPSQNGTGFNVIIENMALEKDAPVMLPAAEPMRKPEIKKRHEERKPEPVLQETNAADNYSVDHSILGDIENNLFRHDRYQ
jgi:hypothetical protein